jgi:predicted acetyltransferase
MDVHNFALTTLSQNPEYFEEVIRLIEEEFHYSEAHQYEKDFAPLMDPLNFENCYLYIDSASNTVAAHLAVCKRILIKNETELKVVLIGGIATHKNFRRQHLFKNLMDHALQDHRDAGLFILWSDLENIYEKFSFHRTGGLIETGKRNFSSSERPSGYEKCKFSSLSDDDFKSIVEMYSTFNEKKFLTLKREEKDWSIIKNMDSIDLYIKKTSHGNISRYFCVNKGRDLTNIIHEVGAINSTEYASLLKDMESYKLWLPETENARFKTSDIFYTAFFKIGDIAQLNTFFTTVTASALKITAKEDDLILFNFKNESFRVSQKDFLQYVFGPRPLEEFSQFALSLYVAGTDSI